ncbi:hypothetical protein A2389_02335 [Candidatus Adlerbacteria bacterium RIFOXYB1_FULL_48_10]|nr:MAG: hypothetical protein A2389_02335 [Candidatus Adlerbacteria bacterium RIFOXYB1_FULL_48_10]OGC95889.1 MAG: hypothetical protein A2590_01335 [Candidatus Adlerbacteria bacterium RIFOXYD1_FULL_48_8]
MKPRGFTLIELLVVIAIIGLLASIVMVSLSSARVKARDAQRAAALHQIRDAVELYASDNGHYPNSNGAWASFDSPTYAPNPIIAPSAATLSIALAPYINNEADPKNLGTDSGYLYMGDNNNYCILIWRTPENMNNFSKSLWPPTRCTTIDSSGQCTAPSAANSVYIGTGTFAAGC